MPLLTLWRIGVLALLRTPWLWGVQALLLAAIPYQGSLRVGTGGALELLRAWSYPAALVGAGLALVGLEARLEFLRRIDARERWIAEWGLVVLAITYLQLPLLVGALACEPKLGLDLGRALADILSADLHLAGLAFLTLTLPMPANARPLSLLALAWWAPALLASSGAPLALRVPLAANAPLHDPSALFVSLATALGLVLLAALARSAARAATVR